MTSPNHSCKVVWFHVIIFLNIALRIIVASPHSSQGGMHLPTCENIHACNRHRNFVRPFGGSDDAELQKNFVLRVAFSNRPCRLSSSQNLPLPPLKKIFLLHVFRARGSGSVEIGRWTSIHTAISQQENIILISHT